MIGSCGSSPVIRKILSDKIHQRSITSGSGVSHAPPVGSTDPIRGQRCVTRPDVPFGLQLAVGIARGSRPRCATLNREHLYGRRASTQLSSTECLDLQIEAGADTG